MRTIKLIAVVAIVMAFGAIGVATASAALKLWKLLPGSVGETFTGTSKKATLRTASGLAISCTKSTLLLEGSVLLEEGSTEKKDATLALAIIHFEGCTSAGLETHSEGDANNIILVHLEIHNCLIGANKFGLLLEPLPLHIEIKAAKLLVLVKGSVIGQLEGKEKELLLTFKLNLKVNAAKEQEFLTCEGGEKEELKAIDDEKPAEAASEEVEAGLLTFDMTIDKTGEEMMEK